jgi:hypothetical protein
LKPSWGIALRFIILVAGKNRGRLAPSAESARPRK